MNHYAKVKEMKMILELPGTRGYQFSILFLMTMQWLFFFILAFSSNRN